MVSGQSSQLEMYFTLQKEANVVRASVRMLKYSGWYLLLIHNQYGNTGCRVIERGPGTVLCIAVKVADL